MLIISLLIFLLTSYVIISAQKMKWHKLDRPSGALLGVVLMVLSGVLTLDKAYRTVDFNTILLLLGMMILIGYLKIANCFKYLSYLLFCIFPGFVFTGNRPLSAITGGLALNILSGTKPQHALEKIDWTLLLFFSGLFIVVGGINKAGFLTLAHAAVEPYLGQTPSSQIIHFSIFSVIASNLVSNVPFVLVSANWIEKFADPKTMWYVVSERKRTFLKSIGVVLHLRKSFLTIWR